MGIQVVKFIRLPEFHAYGDTVFVEVFVLLCEDAVRSEPTISMQLTQLHFAGTADLVEVFGEGFVDLHQHLLQGR